ncbi:MAG: ATP-binding protein [Cyanobacteria bacterium J06598_1]
MPLFDEAAEQWDLDRLYTDLAEVKAGLQSHRRPGLTTSEKRRLRGLLLSYSPAEIAEQEYTAVGTVEVALSQSIYRYVEGVTQHARNSVENWRDVRTWLAEAGYGASRVAINWAQMPDVPELYGRSQELAQLQEWVLRDDACRLIAVNGPAGMGKTSLVITLSTALQSEFESVIWQSLRHRPNFESVVSYWLDQLPAQFGQAESRYDSVLDRFMRYLHSHRCLIVIDNLETILLSGSLTGGYEVGYEDYAELLRRLSEEPHQSCVVVTSRESIAEIHGFSSATSPIRNLTLEGLSYGAAEQVLEEEGLVVQKPFKHLIDQYRGNPLILRIVALNIQELFNGDVSHFLKQRQTLFGNIEYLIAQQCDRLSSEEQMILIQLTQQAEPLPIDRLEQPFSLQAITALRRRSLVEKSEAGFTLRPAVMEYARRYLL